MAKTTCGPTDERWDPHLGRMMPAGFTQYREARQGSLDRPATVKSTSLRNLLDAASTFRAGR